MLINPRQARLHESFSTFSFIEVFGLISMMKFGVPNLDEKSAVSYSEASHFLKDIFNLIQEEENNDRIIKYVIDPLYEREMIMSLEFLEWSDFFHHIQSTLISIPTFIFYFVCFKLLTRSKYFQMPKLEGISRLLEDCLPLLYFSNIYMTTSTKITLIFSSFELGLNFEKLERKLLNYEGPTIILLKINNNKIIGGFNPNKWIELEAGFQSDANCMLFELRPIFKVFHAKAKSLKKQNYAYYERDKGLGFGYHFKEERFRLWIDKNIMNQSYLNANDSIFEGDNFFHESDDFKVM